MLSAGPSAVGAPPVRGVERGPSALCPVASRRAARAPGGWRAPVLSSESPGPASSVEPSGRSGPPGRRPEAPGAHWSRWPGTPGPGAGGGPPRRPPQPEARTQRPQCRHWHTWHGRCKVPRLPLPRAHMAGCVPHCSRRARRAATVRVRVNVAARSSAASSTHAAPSLSGSVQGTRRGCQLVPTGPPCRGTAARASDSPCRRTRRGSPLESTPSPSRRVDSPGAAGGRLPVWRVGRHTAEDDHWSGHRDVTVGPLTALSRQTRKLESPARPPGPPRRGPRFPVPGRIGKPPGVSESRFPIPGRIGNGGNGNWGFLSGLHSSCQ